MNFYNKSKKGKHSRNRHKSDKSGVALILVLWIMVILIAIVAEFTFSMRTELNITRNFMEEEESYQLALAGIEQAKLEILTAKKPFYVYMNEEGILVFGEENISPVRQGKLENGMFSYKIIDEDRKLNINTASLPQLKYLIKNTGVDITDVDTIVDSIVDWRDTDDLHMINGAEENYYQSLENPYSSKDGPFDIIDELLLVKGVSRVIFYGFQGEGEEKKYTGIAQFLTTWSSGSININTAYREVLEAGFGLNAADNIISQRETGRILTPVSGGSTTSFFFTIISTGSAKDGTIKRTVTTTLKKNGDKLEVLYWNDSVIG